MSIFRRIRNGDSTRDISWDLKHKNSFIVEVKL